MSHSIAKNSLSGVATLLFTFTLNLVSSIVTLRVLGPQQTGVFFLFITLNQLVTTVMSIGLSSTNSMLLGKAKYSFNDVNNNTVLFSVLIGVISIIAYYTFRPLIHAFLAKDMDPVLVLISILLVPCAVYASGWNAMMIGMNRISFLNTFSAGQGALSLLLLCFVLFFLRRDVYGAIFSWSIVTALSPFIMLLISSRIERFKLSYNKALFKESLLFGSQIHLGSIATMVWQRIDSFFLNYYHGKVSVGYYSLAVNLTEILWKVTGPIGNAVNSTITGGEKNAAGQMTATAVRHITLILTVLGSLLCLASPLLIRVIYGTEFLPSVKPLLILMAGTIAVGIVMITAIFYANTINKPLFLSGLAWVNAVINILLCIVLIPRYAENGAAFASTLTYMIGAMIILLNLRKELNIPIKNLLIVTSSDLKNYAFLKELFSRSSSREDVTKRD